MNARWKTVVGAIVASLLILTGCSSDSVDAAAGGVSSSSHSSGIPIVQGDWPFVTDERCANDNAPACLLISEEGRQLSGLAATGSRFTSDLDITVEYRGVLVYRAPGPDSANPEFRQIVTFYDVTFPQSMPGMDRLLSFNLNSSSPDNLSWTAEYVGSNYVSEACPNGSGTGGELIYIPEPGETLTFAHAAWASGPCSLLGEHDPFVGLRSDYTYNLGSERVSSSAYFAILDQDPDPDVLVDVRATIEKGSATSSRGDGGMEGFERVLGPWLTGERELVSVNTAQSGGAVSEADGEDNVVAEPGDGPEPVQTLPPPPPPPSDDPAPEGTTASAAELYDLGFSDAGSDFAAGKP